SYSSLSLHVALPILVDPELAAQSLAVGSSPLTLKETEVLQAAAAGGTTARIAEALFLSEGTVRNHISSVIGKLGVTNRAEAVRAAAEDGWICPEPRRPRSLPWCTRSNPCSACGSPSASRPSRSRPRSGWS